jgi:cytochrome b involved in lipid metabolism
MHFPVSSSSSLPLASALQLVGVVATAGYAFGHFSAWTYPLLVAFTAEGVSTALEKMRKKPSSSSSSAKAAGGEAAAKKGAAAAGGKITWQELAKHNTEESAWIAVHGKVYDITAWLDRHPGGKEHLLLAAGREATWAFESYHPFQSAQDPRAVLSKFEIGELASSNFPVYKEDTGLYAELRKVRNMQMKER